MVRNRLKCFGDRSPSAAWIPHGWYEGLAPKTTTGAAFLRGSELTNDRTGPPGEGDRRSICPPPGTACQLSWKPAIDRAWNGMAASSSGIDDGAAESPTRTLMHPQVPATRFYIDSIRFHRRTETSTPPFFLRRGREPPPSHAKFVFPRTPTPGRSPLTVCCRG